jgi:hypothetical protein
MAIGPGDAQRGDEMGLAPVGRGCAALLQQPLDPAHRRHEILALAGPARRVDTGRAIQRVDHEAGIIGKSRKLHRIRRRDRLDRRIGAKRAADFFRFVEAEFARGNGFDAVRRQQFPHLGKLAGIVGRDHEPAGDSTVQSHGYFYSVMAGPVPAIHVLGGKEVVDARVKPGHDDGL